MKKTVAWAYGVFKIPLSEEELTKFREKWREFVEAFRDVEGHTYVVKSQWDERDARLIDAVVDILDKIDGLQDVIFSEEEDLWDDDLEEDDL